MKPKSQTRKTKAKRTPKQALKTAARKNPSKRQAAMKKTGRMRMNRKPQTIRTVTSSTQKAAPTTSMNTDTTYLMKTGLFQIG